jgi:hypothetical protein
MIILNTKDDVFDAILKMKLNKNEVIDILDMAFIIDRCMNFAEIGLKIPNKSIISLDKENL